MKTPARIVSALLVGAALLASPAAFASDDVDPPLKAKLTEQLKAEGYDVRKLQMEDGLIEAYAVKGNEKFELYFDSNLKLVKKGG